MPTVTRSERVPHTAAQMFDLVNDIEAYPEFLHWCRGARVEARTETAVEATLEVGIGGVSKRFTTRNTLDPPHSITLGLVSGPFRRLDGAWTFEDWPDGGSQVSLSLEFEISQSPLSMVFSAVFEEVARSQVSAFVRRAEHQYA